MCGRRTVQITPFTTPMMRRGFRFRWSTPTAQTACFSITSPIFRVTWWRFVPPRGILPLPTPTRRGDIRAFPWTHQPHLSCRLPPVSIPSVTAATATATTVAAGAFVGAATAYGTAALVAITNSTSVEDFNEQSNWGTVTGTALGAVTGGLYGYDMANAQLSSPQQSKHTSETFLPDGYYAKNKAPNISTPNSSYITCKYNAHTGEYEKSTAYYDFAGRQTLRIDWTNHGYADHGNPHVHYTIYSKRFPNGTSIRWDWYYEKRKN